MKVIENFSISKTGHEPYNEDGFLVTDDFIVVMDGATPKRCPQIKGISSARFVVNATAEAMKTMRPDVTAHEAMALLTAHIRTSVAREITLTREMEPPCLGILVYSRARKEVWRLGDLLFMMDGVFYDGSKKVDDITYSARAFMIEIALRRGATLEDIQKNDIGRAYIAPMLNDQHVFANKEGPYGYGVLDGASVPDSFIHVFDASGAKDIVFASDGYPRLWPTWAESEAYLKKVLVEDPLMYRLHPSAKGISADWVSFDDRTYLRFTP